MLVRTGRQSSYCGSGKHVYDVAGSVAELGGGATTCQLGTGSRMLANANEQETTSTLRQRVAEAATKIKWAVRILRAALHRQTTKEVRQIG